jgi:hypothetical protein
MQDASDLVSELGASPSDVYACAKPDIAAIRAGDDRAFEHLWIRIHPGLEILLAGRGKLIGDS